MMDSGDQRTRAGSSTNSVEDKEALQASAIVCQLADAVQAEVHNLLPNCRTKANISNLTGMNTITELIAEMDRTL